MTDNAVRQECCNCGVVFWITAYMQECRLKDAASFYCPNGHAQSYGKSEADKVREQLAKVERERNQLKQNEARYEQELEATRKEAARLRKRAAAGVCPCCNRSFIHLRRHMASRHAGYVAEPVQAQAAA
jgi:DNA repair exonuclease SbcCD ATPase subunit